LRTPNKEHWLGWLSEYDGPGYYGRKNPNRNAAFIYNHINSPPMLVWLAEGAGISQDLIEAACRVQTGIPNKTSACAIIRRVLPWEIVEANLVDRHV
jgi:hypothetical protein